MDNNQKSPQNDDVVDFSKIFIITLKVWLSLLLINGIVCISFWIGLKFYE